MVASDLPNGITANERNKNDAIGSPRAITFTRDDPTQIEIDVAAGAAHHLVMIDTFLPGWRATIDGEATDVVRCNHSQRMIVLPRTACHVTIRYEAPGLMLGFAVMLIGTLLAISAWWLTRSRQRRTPAPVQAQD